MRRIKRLWLVYFIKKISIFHGSCESHTVIALSPQSLTLATFVVQFHFVFSILFHTFSLIEMYFLIISNGYLEYRINTFVYMNMGFAVAVVSC